MSGLPKGWADAPLLDVVELHDNRRVPLNSTERAAKKGDYPYYGANGLVDHVSEYIFDGHYVLLAEDGGNFDKPERGVAYEAEGRFWANNHAHILAPVGDMSPRFLRHWLNSINWMPHVGGSTRLKLTQAGMRQVHAPLPPLPEQRRIVAKVDGLTARTARARKELDRIPTLIARYKQRLLALAFSGELTAGWREERNLAEAKMKLIDDLAEGLRYGTAQKCYSEPKGVAVLRIPNVSAGNVNFDNLKYAELPPKELEKLLLRVGDILVVRSNGSADLVGRPALVDEQAEGLAYAGYLIRIRPRVDLIVPKFLALMLEAPMTRGIFQASARSTNGIHNVNAKELGALPIPVFELEEQAEIVHRIESASGWLDRIAADHAAATKLLPKLDAAILTKAFKGELVPQDPEDEPAKAMLERIRAVRAEAQKLPRAAARAHKIKETATMARNLEEVLTEAADWIPAQEAFRRCGVADGAETQVVEGLYAELRVLDKAGRLNVQPVSDSQGRKLYDKLKLKAA